MSNHTPIQLPLAIEGLTVEIPLTKGYGATVDAIDGDLIQFKWSTTNVRPHQCFYAHRQKCIVNGKGVLIKMHRVVMARVLGRELDAAEFIDHVDGNGLNNRRSNLRLATSQQNNANAALRNDNTSGYKGVTFDKERNMWRALIQVDGKRIRIGRYASAEEAYAAYCTAAKQYFGEFARLK